jgi:hypothetical protein
MEEKMQKSNNRLHRWMMAAALMLAMAMAMIPGQVLAHCDTLDGPVVIDARAALEQKEITPVLKWVSAENEPEIRAAFTQTLAVRQIDPAALDLADRYFFETLVRVHRAGEGAPYTGLKPAGMVEPVIAKADRALEQGNVDALAKTIATHVEAGLRERFAHTLETRKHAAESVAAGRESVAAYVTYVHYVEGIAQAVHRAPQQGEKHAAAPAAHQH